MNNKVKRTLACLMAIIMLLCAVPMSASAKSYNVGDIIQYGNYPQSEVTDSATLSLLNTTNTEWKSYNYYSGTGSRYDGQMKPSNYMQYRDAQVGSSRYRAVKFTAYRPYRTGYTSSASNLYQGDNGYYVNNIYWFKYEPLEWRVLDPTEGLIMCESIIDSQAYQNTVYSYSHEYYHDSTCSTYANDYATSSIRQWLNDDFYNIAFSCSQKSNIKTTTLNNDCPWNSPYDSTSTNDKIFLLSYDEAKTSAYGFSSSVSTYDTARMVQGTDYAKCQGLLVSTSSSYYGNSWWWMRSPGDDSISVCPVSSGGYFGYLETSEPTHTGIGVRPACKVSNLESDISQSEMGKEHTHTYTSTTKATTSKVGKIETKCTVCGDVTKTTAIAKVSTVKLSITSYVYDGKAKTPTVTVKDSNGKTLKKGTDYTVAYKNNKAIGKATATITFKGNYTGTKTLTYNIVPANVKNLKSTPTASSIKLIWSKVTGAAGYRVYKYDTANKKWVKVADTKNTNYTISKLKAGTNYKYAVKAYAKSGGTTYWSAASTQITTATKPATPSLKATAGTKQAALSWNKIAGATGYEVYMATKKDGTYKKVATIKSGSTVKYTKKDLTKGSTYYFKVRAYKTVDGKNIYGAYSAVKNVKVK